MSDTDSFNSSDACARPSLHLLEVSDPQATPLTLAHLASRLAQPGSADAVLVAAGPTLPAAQARALLQGADIDRARVRVIGAPGGQACKALPAWHAAAKTLRRTHDTQGYTLWSPGMLKQPVMRWWLGRVHGGQRVVVTHALNTDARRSWLKQLPDAAQLLGVTDAMSESLSQATQRSVETIPAFAPRSAEVQRDAAGPHTAGNTRDVLLVTDPADRVSAMHALLTVGMADEIVRQVGQRVRLIVPPRLNDLSEAMHTCRAMDPHGQGERMAVEPLAAMPWRVLKSCDAALVLSDRLTASPSPNAITCALRSGVPTVAEDSPVTQLLIDHEQTGLIAAAGKPQRLAHRLVELLSDQALAARLGNAGQQAAEAWCEMHHHAPDAR